MLTIIAILLLLLLPSLTYAQPIIPHILFTYQSRSIPPTTWFDFLTICLAPLVAHIASGVAPTTALHGPSSPAPSLAARLPHFNPVSIVWRYYAIADRRLRARDWDEADMAACNAVFWDGHKGRWDGSEEIMVRSRAWITKLPEEKHVPVLSASSLATVVLTLQGVQAIFLIIAALIPNVPYHIGLGLPYVFFPLGCLGLPRLLAAFWLSNDYGYLNTEEMGLVRGITGSSVRTQKVVQGHVLEYPVDDRAVEANVSDRLQDRHCWKGIVYRMFWIVSICALLGISVAATSKLWWGYAPNMPYCSLSHLMFNTMYLVTTSCGLLIHCTYVLMGRTGTTLIPCIHSTWYKIFTIILIAMALVSVLSNLLETRQLLDGTTTTLPEFHCANVTICIPVAQGHGDTYL